MAIFKGCCIGVVVAVVHSLINIEGVLIKIVNSDIVVRIVDDGVD